MRIPAPIRQHVTTIPQLTPMPIRAAVLSPRPFEELGVSGGSTVPGLSVGLELPDDSRPDAVS
jgi:hypothetical protein